MKKYAKVRMLEDGKPHKTSYYLEVGRPISDILQDVGDFEGNISFIVSPSDMTEEEFNSLDEFEGY